MIFSDQSSASDWVSVTHAGEAIAEAWLMPEGETVTAVFLVPRERLEAGRVSVELLRQAADIPAERVESWRLGDGEADPDPSVPLPPPPADEDSLTVYLRLTPTSQAVVEEIPPEKWQALEVLWKTILGLEAGIDAARLSMDGLRAEMENAHKRTLSLEEKNHALQADVSQWTKAKSRIHYALPKVREFVHRATWALAVPERKRLEEVIKAHLEPRIPFADVDRVREQMEHLQKDRQLLAGQGNAVQQECRGTLSEVQRALSSLQRNAADRARQKRGPKR